MGLARRLWSLLLVPIALGLALYGYVAHVGRHRVLLAEASAELRNHATLVEAAVGGTVDRGQIELLQRRIARVARADRILGIAAFDQQGAAILVTDHIAGSTSTLAAVARRALEQHDDIEEQRELGGRPTLLRTVTFSPTSGQGDVVAVVVRDLGYLGELANVLNRGLALTGGVLLALTALIVGLVSRATVGRPAGDLAAAVERVAGGDLEPKVPEEGAAELARLATAFNAMTNSLREARAHAEHEEEVRVGVERRLQHAQALAAVGQVAASIGHEIGSPLGVILARAQRTLELAHCPSDIKEELDTIARQSERISRVVARLLDVARPSMRKTEDGSDLALVAEEVLGFIAPECRRRRVTARIERHGGILRAALDADQLFQVVFNLCMNALEAQPDGGALTVRTFPLANGARAGGAGKVVIEVEDAGCGVPSEAADRIFDAFFTTKADCGGSGLGLAIVSGIVREAGGSVELVSGRKVGACLRITLPSVRPRAPRAAAVMREQAT
jgi:signal transduction histidine kinase